MKLKALKIHHKNLIILLAITIVFCILTTIPLPWNEPINSALIDLEFKIRGSRKLSDKIVLVYIGGDDIKAINKDKGWPITRDYYGYMVYIFNHFGAKVIGIDVLFSTEDRFYPEYDAVFVDALRSSGDVCLPMTFSELSYDHQTNAKLPHHFPTGYSPSFPIPLFQDNAAGIGFSNFDQERIIRKAPLVVAFQDSFILSFGCELARLYLGVKDSINFFSDAIQMTDTAGKQYDFPVDQHGKLRLNHFGNIQHLNSMSLVDLLKNYEANPDTINFKDKIVLVAVTAPGVMKVASTPLSSVLPATLIHATVLENLVDQNYLKEIPIFTHWIIIILLVAIAWLLFRIKHKIYLVAGIFGVLLGYWIIAIIGFSFANWIIPLFYPTMAFLTTITYLEIRRNIEQSLEEYALKVLLNDQIRTKESQLEAARSKLAEVQTKLSEETIITEQSQQLAAERESTIHKLEKELRDLQTYSIPTKQKLEFAEMIYAENSKMADVLELVATVSTEKDKNA